MVKAVFFDFGHTLFYVRVRLEYRPYGTVALNNVRRLLKEQGVMVNSASIGYTIDDVRNKIANREYSSIEQWTRVLKLLGIVRPNVQFVKRVINAFWAPIVNHARPRAHLAETLETLKSRGYKLGMIANIESEGIYPVLEKYDAGKYFDVVAVSSEVGRRKPDSKIFNFALDTLGVSPRDALMIGDEPTKDILGAQRLGIATLRLLRGPNRNKPDIVKPNYKIRNLDQIPKILEIML